MKMSIYKFTLIITFMLAFGSFEVTAQDRYSEKSRE